MDHFHHMKTGMDDTTAPAPSFLSTRTRFGVKILRSRWVVPPCWFGGGSDVIGFELSLSLLCLFVTRRKQVLGWWNHKVNSVPQIGGNCFDHEFPFRFKILQRMRLMIFTWDGCQFLRLTHMNDKIENWDFASCDEMDFLNQSRLDTRPEPFERANQQNEFYWKMTSLAAIHWISRETIFHFIFLTRLLPYKKSTTATKTAAASTAITYFSSSPLTLTLSKNRHENNHGNYRY
jgi:hypothetical protein